ncbi:MAG TPA: YjbE family putative metal transport protein [Vineibacter sp.]|nr:YjbE family putative metal transport protein [Vineibacter sp.]
MTFAMPDWGAMAFWTALWKIIIADVVLSGDNAVVIALACRNLPARYRSPAIGAGVTGAIGLRIIFCFAATYLLGVDFLRLAGGLLLLWIGIALVKGKDAAAHGVSAGRGVWGAIGTIIVADAVMSLDNAIAIAAAARNDGVVIVIGLIISIPVVVFGSTLVGRILQRYPALVLVGGALMGWIGGEVIATDPAIRHWLVPAVPHADHVCAAVGAAAVAAIGLCRAHADRATPGNRHLSR